MDTDDLTDPVYEVIMNARRINGLLGAELAVSGKHAKSEQEFLQRMLEALTVAREDIQAYRSDDEDDPRSIEELAESIRQLETAIKSLMV
jgi:archaellum component FlaC